MSRSVRVLLGALVPGGVAGPACVFAACACGFALRLPGQTPVIPASASPRANLSARAMHTAPAATVERAEQEGADWPHSSQPSTQPEYTARRDFGMEVPRKCVAANPNESEIRSGDFLIGAEVGGSLGAPMAGREAKIYWVPRHPAVGDTLVVRAALLDSPADTSRFVSANWAVSTGWFYASGYLLPKSGRWLVIATSGPDWGCFILRVD